MSLFILGLAGSPVVGSNCETFLGEAPAAVELARLTKKGRQA